jgi:short-subunit dehydrogenase
MSEADLPQGSRRARRVTLITGASGGIGADLARVFARHRHDLALVARSGVKLEALADEIAAAGRPRPLVLTFDLTGRGAVSELAAALDAVGATPDILVNNAGFGLAGSVAGLDPAEQLAIVDLNVRTLVEMTLRFLPSIRSARGKILNVASIAAYFPGGPGMAAYYASKSFVLSFSLALSRELHSQGVTVSALCPGYTREVAEAGYAGLIAGRREIVPGSLNKLGIALLPFLPKSITLAVISRLQQNRALDR